MSERKQGGPKRTKLVVEVDHAEDISPDQVVKLVGRMIAIGFSDALDTIEDSELDENDGAFKDAEIAISLSIEDPYVWRDQNAQ